MSRQRSSQIARLSQSLPRLATPLFPNAPLQAPRTLYDSWLLGHQGQGDTQTLAEDLRQDILFTGLTRPQMFAGVTYSYFVINAVIAVELFLIFKSWWVLLAALAIHGAGMVLCLNEPRFVDLWLTRVRNCPRVKNHALWRCNSYRP